MLWRPAQVGIGLALVVALAACSAAAVQPAESAPNVVTATATPNPIVSPTESATPLETAVPATPELTEPAESLGPAPTGSPDAAEIIDSYAAMFTATIRLFNLADDDLAVTVSFVDPGSPEPQPIGTYTIARSGRQAAVVPPGTYRLEFHQSSAATGSTCTIAIKDAGLYTFIAVPGAVSVSRGGFHPTKARDLFVPTSSLCEK